MEKKSGAMWAAWNSVGIIVPFYFENSEGKVILITS